jgi:hypothetical protein
MANETERSDHNSLNSKAFPIALGIGIFTTFIALALYGYLGTFSRYGSDDYCLSAFFLRPGNFLQLMVERYMTSSSRYTNILFVGLVDKLLGWYNVAILPPFMLILFVWGTYLFLKEIVRFASLQWSRLLVLLLSMLVVYFSVMQAPNLYETLYWRAGMVSHFAPVVFLTFLGAYLLREMRKAAERSPNIWSLLLCFLGALVIGGFSEPPLTMLITILILALAAVWWWDHTPARRARFSLLSWTLIGSILALLVLALAPANSLRLGTAPPGLVELVFETLKYPLEFIVDIFRSMPLSSLITFLLPAMIFYVYYSQQDQVIPASRSKWILPGILVVSLLSYLLIAASFAPSVYGQSFPVPRARFSGRVVLTCALMLNGALIGMLAAQIRTKRSLAVALSSVAILGLILLTLYPLRMASRLVKEVPVYQQRAAAWDARDAQIREMQASGERDLKVDFLPQEVMQDLGDHSGFRVNRCASILYNIDSIRAIPGSDNQ